MSSASTWTQEDLDWTTGGEVAVYSPFLVEAACPGGLAVSVRARADFDCQPGVIAAVLTNEDNRGILTDAPDVADRKVISHSPGVKVVEVTLISQARVLWLKRRVSMRFTAMEDLSDQGCSTISMTLQEGGSEYLRTYESAFQIFPKLSAEGHIVGTLLEYTQFLDPQGIPRLAKRVPGLYYNLQRRTLHAVHTLLSDLLRISNRVTGGEDWDNIRVPAKSSLVSHPLDDVASQQSCSTAGSPPGTPHALASHPLLDLDLSSWTSKDSKLAAAANAGHEQADPDAIMAPFPSAAFASDTIQEVQNALSSLLAQDPKANGLTQAEQDLAAAISISPRGPLLEAIWEQAAATEAALAAAQLTASTGSLPAADAGGAATGVQTAAEGSSVVPVQTLAASQGTEQSAGATGGSALHLEGCEQPGSHAKAARAQAAAGGKSWHKRFTSFMAGGCCQPQVHDEDEACGGR